MKLITIFTTLLLAVSFNAKAAATTDGEILDVVRTANNAEITAAELASTKATSPKVREFASKMIKEHKKNNTEAESVTKKSNISFSSSDRSEAIKSDADSKVSSLEKTPANSRAFDRAYIEQQVAMHRELLHDLDNNLIPTSKNVEVRTYLQKTKSHVQSHLAEATKLLSEL